MSPRGVFRTSDNYMNSREAKALLRDIEVVRRDIEPRLFDLGQGAHIIELRRRERPYDLLGKVRTRAEWNRYQLGLMELKP